MATISAKGVHITALCILTLMCARLHAAPPKVDALFPAGMQQGSETTVKASGTFAKWPANVAISKPGLTWKAGKKKGEFQVTAAADATPGLYWLRFYNDEGASTPRPFVVGQLPDITSQEPNDEVNAVQQVTAPVVINGKLEKSGDVDGYRVKLEKGDTLVASLSAHRPFNSPMDGVLQICDEAGFVLAQNDDARGFDPQLAFTATDTASYLVRLFAFPATPNSTIGYAGGASYIYRLTLTTGPFITHTLPAAAEQGETTEVKPAGWNLSGIKPQQVKAEEGGHDISFATAESNAVTLPVISHKPYVLTPADAKAAELSVKLPATITGQLRSIGEHRIRFTGKKGDNIRCEVQARSLHSPLDAVVELFSADKKLQTYDDTNKKPDPQFSRKLTADGQHTLVIRDLHDRSGEEFFYRLTLDRTPPDFQLTVTASEFSIPAGKPLEIPVTVIRSGGLRDEVSITATGLPPGVTCTTVTSASSGETAKKVTLQLKAAKAVNAAFQITGVIAGKPGKTRQALFPLADFDANIKTLWLTAPVAGK